MKISYGKQEILPEDIEAVVETLKSDFLTQGPAVSEFENEFAKTVGVQFAVAVNNATAALHLAFKGLNQSLNKKVLVTPLSFAATSNCVLFEGGHLEFVDIDPQSFNMDLGLLEEKLKFHHEDYQGIIVVDFAGLPVNTEKLHQLAQRYKLWIIEDACHAVGASFKDSKETVIPVGSCRYSDVSVFSFHPVKHIAAGEGGMITTNDEKLYRHLLRLRSHGIEKDPNYFRNSPDGGWYYEMQELGYNYRMPDINASLALSQLKRLPTNIQRRQEIARKYSDAFRDLPLTFQMSKPQYEALNAFHLFVIQADRRNELYEYLRSNNIFSQVHYIPIYWQPFYQKLGFKRGLCPKAESYYARALSLPIYHSMTSIEQDFVIEKVRELYAKDF